MVVPQAPERAWRCRLCGFDRFHRVTVLRKNGSRYDTEFFACSNCSVMFLNNLRFDAFSKASPSISPRQALGPLA